MPNGELTLNELTNLIGRLRKQRMETQQRLDEVDNQLEAVETTIRLLSGTTFISSKSELLISELQGKTQLNALITIAGKTNNRFKVTDAKRLMIQAGLISNPKSALSMLYTIINRSGKFDKVKPGEYRLIDTQQILLK